MLASVLTVASVRAADRLHPAMVACGFTAPEPPWPQFRGSCVIAGPASSPCFRSRLSFGPSRRVDDDPPVRWPLLTPAASAASCERGVRAPLAFTAGLPGYGR
ncbi:MAG TPA: hypothetical protein DCK98_13250 [Chloroflexi bacterium]|nr:hypothetical protein [Chloroflexota bacterium]HAL26176.1 hypothetical protein [Chloroflexota bacterium]